MLFVPREIIGLPFTGKRVPVYLQDWFTEIAGRYEHSKHFVVLEDGRPVGSLTITIMRNPLGMRQGYNLPWARLCGPSFADGLSETKKAQVTRELIGQLPTDVSYFLVLANERDYELFLSEGFRPALEYNYTIATDQFNDLEESFSSMTKRHICQARRQLIVSSTTADDFIRIYAADLARRRRKPNAPLAIARDLIEEGLRRGQARIFTAKRRDTGEIDAAIACLWDTESYYYWLTTRRVAAKGESKPSQGAIKLLLLSAIEDAAARGLTFDFDGVETSASVKENGKSRLYDGMGAQPSVRYRVKRETALERILGRSRAPVKFAIRKTFGSFMALKLNP